MQLNFLTHLELFYHMVTVIFVDTPVYFCEISLNLDFLLSDFCELFVITYTIFKICAWLSLLNFTTKAMKLLFLAVGSDDTWFLKVRHSEEQHVK